MPTWEARLSVTFEYQRTIAPVWIDIEAESFEGLVFTIQYTVVSSPERYRIVPAESNPPTALEAYAKSLRQDLPESPWGDQLPITGYFEVNIEDGGLWIYSHAQHKIDALQE